MEISRPQDLGGTPPRLFGTAAKPETNRVHLDNDTSAEAIQIAAILSQLADLNPAYQVELIRSTVIETGGTWIVPEPGNTWSSQTVEISLFGVSGIGSGPTAAVRRWADNARRQLEAQAA